jgi:hypothetical protein
MSLESHSKVHGTDVTQAGGRGTAYRQGSFSERLQGGLHLGEVHINFQDEIKTDLKCMASVCVCVWEGGGGWGV